jgi:hypothetical protein
VIEVRGMMSLSVFREITMEDIDPKEIEIESTYPAGRNFTIRYRGHYAGSIERQQNGEYACAVDMERHGQKVLQRFGRSDSKEGAAESVVRQWLLSNTAAKLKVSRRRFFLPKALDDTQTDRVYKNIIEHARKSTGWDIESRKIYSLSFTKERKNYIATVGEVDSYSGGMVIAILESTGTAYLLYVANSQGPHGPVMINKGNIRDVIEFID